MKLLVGGPVRRRHWVLPAWRDAVLAACERAGAEPEFLFITSLDGNGPTCELLESWTDTSVIYVTEPDRHDIRFWTTERMNHMADLRQRLVMEVRKRKPDLFLSLDTDILLAPDAIKSMCSVIATTDAWAVGGKAHMSYAGVNDPSFGIIPAAAMDNGLPRYGPRASTNFHRYPSDETMRVDVVMAVILITRRAYNVDYSYHPSGEDIGWSLKVADAGGELWWDGAVTNKHLMAYPNLFLKDPRSW